MGTMLRVLTVLHTPDYRVATLEHREWFVKNPEADRQWAAYQKAVDERGQEAADAEFLGELPDEYLPATPDNPGAFHVVPDGSHVLTLRVPDDCEWQPGDDVDAMFTVARDA